MSEDRDLWWLKIGKRTLFRPEDITAYNVAKMAPVRLAS
jgi:hypothetical protein